jgi:hypothetical protein
MEKVMIELNKEYTYENICKELEWKKATGYQKQRQIKAIEESYEFYHPINKKTHKPKKSYIFTKQIKDISLEDNRGGFRENAGRKLLLPEEEFDYLWREVVIKAYNLNNYYERDTLNKVYFANSLLFTEFGFSYGYYLDKAKFKEDDKIVKFIFSDIVYDALKANTITRLCKRYGFKKNNFPKGILRSRSKNNSQLIDDDKLLDKYNEVEAETLKELKCKDIKDVVRQGRYQELIEIIQGKFEIDRKYNVKKFNVIEVTDFNIVENSKRLRNHKKLNEYQRHFREIIFTSVEKSCMRRIEDTENKYKFKLNENQKKLLKTYLDNMLGREKVVIEVVEDYKLLKKIS